MTYQKKTLSLLHSIMQKGEEENKLTGFTIGNTSKVDKLGLYFTPMRNTSIMVTAGVIVYSEQQAIDIARLVDGKVNYVLVDAEKKAPHQNPGRDLANVERVVRENVHHSMLWIYKGNDLCVEAVDGLLTQLTKKCTRGVGGKKVAILGAGNIGFKLALRLVERGAEVVITRRNKAILDALTQTINILKPKYTRAQVTGMTNNTRAAKGAQILIGSSRGVPVITAAMIHDLADEAIIIDVGKGVLFPEALSLARQKNIPIFRLDISAAYEGLLHHLLAAENLVDKKLGSRNFHNEPIISGGLLGQENEIVVDNAWAPKTIYGIADGKGDFIRELSAEQRSRLQRLQKLIESESGITG